MTPEFVILARLLEDVTPTEAVPVTPFPCSVCGRTCGISPSSVKAIRDHGWSVNCFDCERGRPTTIYAVLPEALKEMRTNRLTRDAGERRN